MDEKEIRRRVRDLLVPGGESIGRPGRSRSGTVRVLGVGEEAARSLFAGFEEIGETEEVSGYPGKFVSFVGGRVGLRLDSRSGDPTIDVTISYVPEVEKLKFERGHENDR